MRDTGGSQSFVVKGSVPGIENCLTDDSVVVNTLGGIVTVPLARVYLNCGLHKGDTMVGVVDALPVPGVDFLVGNDIAGSRVVPNPIVVSAPLSGKNEGESLAYPSCVIERSKRLYGKFDLSMTGDSTVKSAWSDSSEDGIRSVVEEDLGREEECTNSGTDLLDSLSTLFEDNRIDPTHIELDSKQGNNDKPEVCVLNVTETLYDTPMVDIKTAQENDPSLQTYFSEALNESESAAEPTCFYLKMGILMRKY